ncbi:chorismate mutase (plasmid) [Streptomyces sp. NBC_01260]|uniref:chorismate mutase n=1 Tax=unclassified Streptomyces TaxID=2593676 RepID=UPI000F98B2B4|nr:MULTISPECIES: chorismate mutase [unclassified Streptomyces]MCX4775213.1 chorismate mutase [Streptomyces sp. NBC_01285]ROQ65372.1 chorismate mutase [Streptomyces sp. CEV 2-1]RPK32934.1 Chorismate mutase AroH [Streptomyces sp. ADI92-24]
MTTPTSQVIEPVPLAVRAVRGATQVASDDPALIEAATSELLGEILRRNDLSDADLISIVFTTTHDLRSAFPAAAARKLGLTDVPLLCTAEIAVPGSLQRVVRILAHAHSPRPRDAMHHVYLGAAAALRPDLTAPPPRTDSPLTQGA